MLVILVEVGFVLDGFLGRNLQKGRSSKLAPTQTHLRSKTRCRTCFQHHPRPHGLRLDDLPDHGFLLIRRSTRLIGTTGAHLARQARVGHPGAQAPHSTARCGAGRWRPSDAWFGRVQAWKVDHVWTIQLGKGHQCVFMCFHPNSPVSGEPLGRG